MKFEIIDTKIDGLVVIKPKIFGDERGFFLETYNKEEFNKIGLDMEFIQDNHSKSKIGVLRGLHFQLRYPQGKLVRVTRGKVWDVAVDLRKDSTTYKKWFGVELSADNKKMFYIPEGFAHGFLTLEDDTEFQYKCTNLYYPEFDSGIRYDDTEIKIEWPKLDEYILSEKDKQLKYLIDHKELF